MGAAALGALATRSFCEAAITYGPSEAGQRKPSALSTGS